MEEFIMKKISYIIFLGSFLLTSIQSQATIYKWKNASGYTIYSSRAPSDKSIKLEVINAPNVSAAMKISQAAASTPAKPPIVDIPVVTPPTTTGGLPTAPSHYYMPDINSAKIPTGDVGSDQLRLTQTNNKPNPSGGAGEFRLTCNYSHMNFDDPIVFPGKKGASHLHVFFGNSDTNYLTTANSLAISGNSTCQGGVANRSGYWVPAMIDTANSTPIKPAGMVVYYKGNDAKTFSYIKPAPQGLRMIAGSMLNFKSNVINQQPHYYCDPSNDANKDGFAISSNSSCKDVTWPDGWVSKASVVMVVNFPQCWDGINLDSPDHKSHMAFAGGYPTINGCPTTHPVLIPTISFNVRYYVPAGSDTTKWRLSSDMYPNSSPGGYSGHGDWFNGWKPELMDLIASKCLAGRLDCGSNSLPDGRNMY